MRKPPFAASQRAWAAFARSAPDGGLRTTEISAGAKVVISILEKDTHGISNEKEPVG